MKPWHVRVYLAALLALAVYQRASGWEPPRPVRLAIFPVVLACQLRLLWPARRTRNG